MTEVLSSRKLCEVPAFKGKDVTGQELTSIAESCPALQALKKSSKETSTALRKAGIYQPFAWGANPKPFHLVSSSLLSQVRL